MPIITIIINILSPKRWLVVCRKFWARLSPRNSKAEVQKAVQWYSEQASSMEKFMREWDSNLYEESMEFSARFKEQSEKKLEQLGFDMGGGGSVELLYFLARFYKPMFCVVTGVAAGHSSAAILHALKENGKGQLFSSDLPYFRIDEPEQYIGLLVEEELKDRWVLATDGDDENLSHLPREFAQIEFFHYDSDKSYEGRKRTLDRLSSKFSPDTN